MALPGRAGALHVCGRPGLGSACACYWSIASSERSASLAATLARPGDGDSSGCTLARPRTCSLRASENVLRSFESHSDERWGLGGLAAWPRIAALLSDRERDLHADAETDFMFFVNCCTCSALLVPALAIGLWGGPPVAVAYPIILAAMVSYGFYRGAVIAAVGWGTEVRASLDLHRLELYERLGVRLPASFSDERFIAWHVTQMIEFGEPLPDRLWGPRTWS